MSAPRRSVLWLRAATLGAACALALTGTADAKTIAVSVTGDPVGAGSCPGAACSLRQAVAAADPGDTVQLGAGTYALTQGVTLTIDKLITVAGAGAGSTTIDALHNVDTSSQFGTRHRALKVTAAGNASLTGLTVSGGDDAADEAFVGCSPCLTMNANGGGALFNAGTAHLSGVVFRSDGGSTPMGGAVSNSGTLDMTDVTFDGNGAAFGGALLGRSGTIVASGVTFTNNGGGTFDGGAAFFLGGTATFTNTTVHGNGWASGRGGGFFNAGASLKLVNVTFAGDVRGSLTRTSGTTSVTNTMLASGFSDGLDYTCVAPGQATSAAGNTVVAVTSDLGGNLDQDNACGLTGSTDLPGIDPKLGDVADNGGPTMTQALLAGSPAIGAGIDANCPVTDQRGLARPQGTHCDVGAYEFGTFPVPVVIATTPPLAEATTPPADEPSVPAQAGTQTAAATITTNGPPVSIPVIKPLTVGVGAASGTHGSVPVTCAAGAAAAQCAATLTLSVTETLRGGKILGVGAKTGAKPKKTTKHLVIGTATVSATPGHTTPATVALNRAGRKLLTARGHFTATLTVAQGTAVLATQTLTFKAPKKH